MDRDGVMRSDRLTAGEELVHEKGIELLSRLAESISEFIFFGESGQQPSHDQVR